MWPSESDLNKIWFYYVWKYIHSTQLTEYSSFFLLINVNRQERDFANEAFLWVENEIKERIRLPVVYLPSPNWKDQSKKRILKKI